MWQALVFLQDNKMARTVSGQLLAIQKCEENHRFFQVVGPLDYFQVNYVEMAGDSLLHESWEQDLSWGVSESFNIFPITSLLRIDFFPFSKTFCF